MLHGLPSCGRQGKQPTPDLPRLRRSQRGSQLSLPARMSWLLLRRPAACRPLLAPPRSNLRAVRSAPSLRLAGGEEHKLDQPHAEALRHQRHHLRAQGRAEGIVRWSRPEQGRAGGKPSKFVGAERAGAGQAGSGASTARQLPAAAGLGSSCPAAARPHQRPVDGGPPRSNPQGLFSSSSSSSTPPAASSSSWPAGPQSRVQKQQLVTSKIYNKENRMTAAGQQGFSPALP